MTPANRIEVRTPVGMGQPVAEHEAEDWTTPGAKMHQDPHSFVHDREEEDERELTRAAIAKLNELRRHSLEVSSGFLIRIWQPV